MKILAISGSLRADSSNMTILKALSAAASQDHDFLIDDHIGRLPHFIPGGETPDIVLSFYKAIDEADVVLFCTPEYAHGMPGVLKNALDWTVASGNFYEKPVSVITASSQGEKCHAALLQTLRVLTAKIIPNATLLIPFIRSKIDADGHIDAATLQELKNLLISITSAANQVS